MPSFMESTVQDRSWSGQVKKHRSTPRVLVLDLMNPQVPYLYTKGLAFLHSSGVSVGYGYLFKFNPSGVLLDSDYNPKLHGFSRLPNRDYGQKHAQIFFAYVYSDPEYIAANYGARGIPIPYYDVYSYGVVLLEVLLGRRVTLPDEDDHHWAQLCQPPHKCCQLDQLMDKGLKGKYPWDTAHAMVKLAIRCQSNDLRSRPSMAEVVVELEALQSSASSSTSRWTENKNK
ncbi:putative serine/threonine-protein kinase PBL10 [Bidens hawaiensis]|uniref:putative serine/threonine-protein kinase PBL10 n=1 Tax=Bidens hawaiensis TaxID=980011 RepID=UPI00404943E4